MRVLHVYRTYFPDPPGGLQEAIRQIALSVQSEGVASSVFTLSPRPGPEELSFPEGRVVRSRSWAAPASCDLGGWSAFRRFADMAKTVDVIHYHFPWPFADLLHLAVRPAVPAVMTYHSDIVRQRFLKRAYSPLMHRMLVSMSAIVATSPAYAATSPVLADKRIAGRVRIIPLGINEDSFSEKGDDRILRRLGLAEDEPYFLFVGVLRQYKGLHFLVRAAVRINAKIVIAGSGPEGDALQSHAKELGVENVIFAGQVSNEEKISLLKHCWALVLPSYLRSEAFGMVQVEAAMFSKPLICCEVGSGTSYINADGKTGFVVPPENPDALAKAVSTLLDDPDLAEQFGQAARRRYQRLFSGEALGLAYAQLYNDVLVRL